MANSRDITITISADGSAAIAGIRQVGDETGKFGSRTTSFLDQVKQDWVRYTAMIYAAAKSIEGAWNLAENAMKVEAQAQMLDRLTAKYGSSAAEITRNLQDASNRTISHAEAVALATKGIFSGLDPDQMTRLMEVTGAAARANGITVAEAYEKIATAAETGRSRGLRQMGIIVDLEKAHADYAARLNTTAKELSEEEKQVASVNAILERQNKIMDELGPAQDNMRTKVLQLKSAWADLKEQIGGVLVQLASGAFSAIDRVAGAFGESLAYLDRTGGASGSWGVKSTPTPGPDVREWSERQEKLAEIMRKIREAQTLSEASEIDKSRIQNDAWFSEQQKKLRELGASDAEYSALVTAYAAKRHADISAWATKTSDFYLEVQRANAKENDEIEKARNAALFAEMERGVQERLAIQDTYAKAGDTESGTDAIRRKAEGEREILAIRQQGLLASITEQTTFAETLKIMEKYQEIVNKIAESKRLQGVDTEAQRMALEQQVRVLEGQQKKAGPILDQEDYEVWEAIQDQKIQKLLELGNTEASLKAYYREYDLKQEDLVQQQKLYIIQAGFASAAGLADAFYRMSHSKSLAAFRAYQVMKSGETVISTAAAVMKAMDEKTAGTYYERVAMAASVAIMGAAQLAAIWSASPTGGNQSIGGVSAGGGATSGAGMAAVPSAPVTSGAGAPVINVHIYGNVVDHDAFAREIIPSITKAVADGAR